MKYKFLMTMMLLTMISVQLSSAQTKMNADQFDSLLSKNKTVQLIDVRTPGEVATGYIKGAVNMDYSADDFTQRLIGLDKFKPIGVYCAAGGRSGKTATKLKQLGFTQIYDLTTGMTEWKAKNKAVETDGKH